MLDAWSFTSSRQNQPEEGGTGSAISGDVLARVLLFPAHGKRLGRVAMNKTCELCYLGQNVSNGGYVLLPFVANHLVEPVSNISQEEMDSNGLSILLNHLRNPPVGAKVMSFSDAETRKRMLKLKRDHVLINLCLLRTTSSASSVTEELEFFPLHGKHGFSFQTRAEDRRLVPLPIANEEFLEHLRIVFDVAS